MRSDTSVHKLVPKREVDPDTGTMDTNYYWETRLAPKVQIKGKLVDQLSGYTLIKKDLDSAHQWIKQAERVAAKHKTPGEKGYLHATARDDFDIIKAYFVASLTFYAKCFTEASGRHANVSRDWIGAKYRAVHDSYMRYRHSFAAHSGNEGFELAKTYVLLHPDRKMFIPYLPTARMQVDISMPSPEGPGFVELIEHVSERVVEKYNKLAQKIIHDFVIPAGVEYWSSAVDKEDPVQIGLPPKRKR